MKTPHAVKEHNFCMVVWGENESHAKKWLPCTTRQKHGIKYADLQDNFITSKPKNKIKYQKALEELKQEAMRLFKEDLNF